MLFALPYLVPNKSRPIEDEFGSLLNAMVKAKGLQGVEEAYESFKALRSCNRGFDEAELCGHAFRFLTDSKPEIAFALLEICKKEFPESWLTQFWLGRVFLFLNDHERAGIHFIKAQERNPLFLPWEKEAFERIGGCMASNRKPARFVALTEYVPAPGRGGFFVT